MTDRIEQMVFIYYTKTVDDLTFKGVLRFRQNEYDSLTPEEIEGMKQNYFDRWVAAVRAAPDATVLDVTTST